MQCSKPEREHNADFRNKIWIKRNPVITTGILNKIDKPVPSAVGTGKEKSNAMRITTARRQTCEISMDAFIRYSIPCAYSHDIQS